MRKCWWLVILALMFACLPGQAAMAADNPVKVYIKGKQVEFAADPVIESGTTLVPFRAVFEQIGLQVGWDDSEKKVTGTRKGTNVQLTIGSRKAVVNGKFKELEVPPKLINGYTYVPLRLVGEASDYHVDWKADTQTVELKSTVSSIFLEAVNNRFVKAESLDGQPVDRDWTGEGRLTMETSALYEGDLLNGEPNGHGKFMIEQTLYYEGEWRDSRFEGEGKLYSSKGLQYEGQFREGLRSGRGKEYDENGKLFYDGEFAQDIQKGTGTFYRSDGSRLYEGEADNDTFQGRGTLYYKNGKIQYEGGFVNDEFDGSGKLYTSEGKLIYEGAFVQGKPADSFASYLTGQLAKAHDWKSFRTKHFHVYYYTDETEIKSKAEKFDGIYDSVNSIFGREPSREKGEDLIPVYLVSPDDFKDILKLQDERLMGLWYDTVMLVNSKVLVSNNTLSIYQTFQHELVHAMTVGTDDFQAKGVPGWFVEGVATYHENDSPYTSKVNERQKRFKEMVRTNGLLPWDSLSEGSSKWDKNQLLQGYAEAWSIWGYLAETYGEDALNQIFDGEGSFDDLLKKVTHKSLKEVEQDWRDYVQGRN